jgi:hypothetical protein
MLNSMVDISDFLTDEIRGPAKFSCKTGAGCKFEEPAMNSLILSIFGDAYISLQCEGGECLHYSQVPGYVVCNSIWFRHAIFTSACHLATTQTRQHPHDRP